MFTVYKRAIADVEPFEYLPGAEELTLGMAVKMDSGMLAKCAATDKPGFIVAGEKRADGSYPVVRVLDTTIYETVAGGEVAADKVGTTLQLNGTADGVTATAGGSFVVTETDGGTLVRGYFDSVAG